jgi:hypothetical protein
MPSWHCPFFLNTILYSVHVPPGLSGVSCTPSTCWNHSWSSTDIGLLSTSIPVHHPACTQPWTASALQTSDPLGSLQNSGSSTASECPPIQPSLPGIRQCQEEEQKLCASFTARPVFGNGSSPPQMALLLGHVTWFTLLTCTDHIADNGGALQCLCMPQTQVLRALCTVCSCQSVQPDLAPEGAWVTLKDIGGWTRCSRAYQGVCLSGCTLRTCTQCRYTCTVPL